MGVLGSRGRKVAEQQSRILDVTASMEGSLVFQEPVQLRISGRFQGTLQTRGELTIGEAAQVRADITGDAIQIAGRVEGKIVAKRSLRLTPPAVVQGEVWTPVLQVEPGAQIEGTLHMGAQGSSMSMNEVAEYLEVEPRLVEQWAREGRLPAAQEAGQWKFEKSAVDHWVETQKSS